MSLRLATPPSPTITRNLRDLRVRLGHVSSGRRVDRAADDAAGLAVGERLGIQAACKRVALRNIGQALDMLDVADGGMAEVAELLVRARELATQAASETLSAGARALVQEEYEATLDSINHAAQSTTWGERPLLSFQSVDVGLIVDCSGSMGGEIAATKAAIGAFRETLLDAGLNVGLGLAIMGDDSLDGVSQRADIGSAAFVTELAALGMVGAAAMEPYSALLNASGAEDLPGEDDPDAFGWRANPERRVLIVVTDTGRETSMVGHSGSTVGSMLAAHDIEVHTINPPGNNGTFTPVTTATGGQTWDIGDSSGSGIAAALTAIAEDLGSSVGGGTSLQVQVSHASGDSARVDLELPLDATSQGLGLSGTSVGSVTEARAALDVIDAAMGSLGAAQSQVGASTNRLLYALENEATALGATEAASSCILDADMAGETAAMAREQILVDASIGVAAQAWRLEQEALEKILG